MLWQSKDVLPLDRRMRMTPYSVNPSMPRRSSSAMASACCAEDTIFLVFCSLSSVCSLGPVWKVRGPTVSAVKYGMQECKLELILSWKKLKNTC